MRRDPLSSSALLRLFPALVILVLLAGCASLNYSELNPKEKDFHPKTIAVLPVTVGDNEPARDVVDAVMARKLAESRWFQNVVDPVSIKNQITASTELANDVQGYIQKVNTLGVSDPAVTAKLKGSFNADALLLTYVTAWGYGRQDGNKVARVGLGVKLVDASNGAIVWKASHEIVEDYMILKPGLDKISDKVAAMLIKEMPH